MICKEGICPPQLLVCVEIFPFIKWTPHKLPKVEFVGSMTYCESAMPQVLKEPICVP